MCITILSCNMRKIVFHGNLKDIKGNSLIYNSNYLYFPLTKCVIFFKFKMVQNFKALVLTATFCLISCLRNNLETKSMLMFTSSHRASTQGF